MVAAGSVPGPQRQGFHCTALSFNPQESNVQCSQKHKYDGPWSQGQGLGRDGAPCTWWSGRASLKRGGEEIKQGKESGDGRQCYQNNLDSNHCLCFAPETVNSSQVHLKNWGGGGSAAPHSMWDLSSMTTDWTYVPCVGSAESKHWTIREIPRCLLAKLYLTVLRPHWLLSARLLCPWDFPGKNTGVSCHFLLSGGQGIAKHLTMSRTAPMCKSITQPPVHGSWETLL